MKNKDEPIKNKITIHFPVEVETVEKKSRFIANLAPAGNEEEARKHIEKIKNRYPDATHNVFAYYIDYGTYARYSDDGEPQGTSGMPTLNVLKMSGLSDICVVVTRYFGGILLGSGGLVRAYSGAARAAINVCQRVVYEPFTIVSASLTYSEFQKISKIIEPFGAKIEDRQFGQNVTLTISVPDKGLERLSSEIKDLSSGSADIIIISKEERPRPI